MDQQELAKTCFFLGIMVAGHVYGTRRSPTDSKTDAIFAALKEVADGSLTVMDTPEEVIADIPEPPPGVKLNIDHPVFREMLRIGRENQRIAAQIILPALPK